ncbi:MAG TPA: PrgI family protein [bacterium]|nr:PrgI family protein [bacterium]
MSQYLIPQKTQREDKIVGPLTGKQLVFGLITVTGSWLLYNLLDSNPLIYFSQIERIFITFPFLLLGLAFTFVEINERPFELYFAAFLTFITTPKTRIWQKEHPPLASAGTTAPASKDTPSEQPAVTAANMQTSLEARAKIAQLSQLLDKPEHAASLQQQAEAQPTTKTLQLLKLVESDENNSVEENLQIVAKPKKGLGNFFSSLGKAPQKIFSGLIKDTTPLIASTPDTATDASPDAESIPAGTLASGPMAPEPPPTLPPKLSPEDIIAQFQKPPAERNASMQTATPPPAIPDATPQNESLTVINPNREPT